MLLDNVDRKAEAMHAYQAALRTDPGLGNCHHDLALLCEKLGRPKEAIRHISRYHRLIGMRSK